MSVAKAWPLHPTGIVARFAGGIGVLALLFTFIAVYTKGQLDLARGTVTTMIDTEHPRSAAAFELEINTLGTGLAIVKYLRKPDPAHKARIEKDSADFEAFLQAHRAVAQSDRERTLLDMIEERYGEFHRLGNALVGARDEEVAGVKAVIEPLREIEDSIESAFLSGIDESERDYGWKRELAGIIEDGIETIVDMVGAAVTPVGLASTVDLGRFRSEVATALRSLAALDLDAEQADSVALARRNMERVDAILDRVLDSERLIADNFDRLIVLRDDLDVLLDEHIQTLVAEDLALAYAKADSSMSAVTTAVVYGAAGLSVALLLAIVALTRAVVIPLRRTADAATAFGRGEFGRRLAIAGNHEFATLARAFNAMAERVQQAHGDLEQANAKLSQMVGDLRQAGERLEDRVKERTKDLERANAERQAAEDALRLKQAELAHVHRLDTMSEMAVALVHEISQPLSAISAYAVGGMELLRPGTADPEELRHVLTQILARGTHAREVLRGIRARMRRAQPSETPIDLGHLVAAAARLLELEANRNGVTLSLDLADRLPKVRGDAIQLEQVIMNLALNAIEAMSGAGTPARRWRIATARAGADAVEIAVEDSGPGIEATTIETVFEPFHTTKDHGMGMGLAISRSIVEEMGGRLWATSDGISGATFHARLPVTA